MKITQKYLDILGELKGFSKELDKDVVIEIIRQIGIDSRLQKNDKEIKKIVKEKDNENIEPATEKQIKLLNKLKIKFGKNLTKKEAWAIIHYESKKNKQGKY